MMHAEFERWYPASRFILTLRKDVAAWRKSALAMVARRKGDPVIAGFTRQFLFTHFSSLGVAIEEPANIYNFHNVRAREFMGTCQERSIELCWEKGDGWKELCRFLGVRVPPGLPFPRENQSPPDTGLIM
jgi:hypothetical protein